MKKLMSLMLAVTVTLTSFGVVTAFADEAVEVADTIYFNGKIVTVDKDFSYAEAVAVKGTKIMEVGTADEIKKLAGEETEMVDLGGKTMFPGFLDTHLHYQRFGLKAIQIDGIDASKETILDSIEKKAAELGDESLWIRGSGWNQEIWALPQFPTKEDLDAVSPNNPVALVRSDNHTLWVNSKALELAGITKSTKDPEGGVIQRDDNGEPNGILVDTAMDLVNSKIPAWSDAEIKMAYIYADKIYSENGITTVGDAGDDADIPMQKELLKNKEINTRIYTVLDKKTADVWLEEGKKPEFDLLDDHMTIRAIKLKADGALGSRGAKLLAPYSDMADVTGNTLITKEELFDYVKRADELGYQLHVHAIGDSTNRDALDAIESSVKSGKNPNNKNRHGIVHAQVLSMQDVPRFDELNVIALMQPVHATGDMNMAETRVGPWRILSSYAWKTLHDRGVVIAGGSDSPNDYVEPLYGIHALVTRQNRDSLPNSGWYPQECLSIEEAIRVYTINGAYALFQENIKGSIEKGKLADFVILSDDLTTMPKEKIHEARVLKTIVGNEVVYSRY